MNCTARWRLRGEHKGKVRINREVTELQRWRVEFKVQYKDRTSDQHILTPETPCTLGDIFDVAMESVHELLHCGKELHDADMKFFVLPAPLACL